MLEALARQRPGLVGIGDDLRGGDGRGILFGEQPAVFAVDDRNLIGDPSGGGNQRIDPRERRPEIGRHGMRQVGQVLRLVDQHLGLVGELLHLIADLLEGTRRRQNVLGVVGRIVDDIADAEDGVGVLDRRHGQAGGSHGRQKFTFHGSPPCRGGWGAGYRQPRDPRPSRGLWRAARSQRTRPHHERQSARPSERDPAWWKRR